jgi:quinoprotein glucose dehydrogenase
MRERQAAWDLLGAIDRPPARQAIAEGVRRYLDGEVALDTQLNLLEAAKDALPETLQQQLTTARRKQAASSPAAAWSMVREGGDPEAGRRLFFNETQLSCVRCHRVKGTGGEVGPDLSAIGRERDRQYLLESIALPDAAIAKGFETAVIADDLGTIHTGIVKRETEEEIELIDADGKRKVLQKDEIIDRQQGKSAMPADLVKLMSPREFRDLVAYLASLNAADPAASAEAHGEP